MEDQKTVQQLADDYARKELGEEQYNADEPKRLAIAQNFIDRFNACLELREARKNEDQDVVFILRAKDRSNPGAIMGWVNADFERCIEEKDKDAFEYAIVTMKWPVAEGARTTRHIYIKAPFTVDCNACLFIKDCLEDILPECTEEQKAAIEKAKANNWQVQKGENCRYYKWLPGDPEEVDCYEIPEMAAICTELDLWPE